MESNSRILYLSDYCSEWLLQLFQLQTMIVINVEIWFFMLFFIALVAHCSSRIKPIVYDGDKNSVIILVEIYQHLNDSDKRHLQKKK